MSNDQAKAETVTEEPGLIEKYKAELQEELDRLHEGLERLDHKIEPVSVGTIGLEDREVPEKQMAPLAQSLADMATQVKRYNQYVAQLEDRVQL